MSGRAERTARVVRAVVAGAVREAAAGGVVVLEDWTPEGELVYEWLIAELGEERVWRAASLASNVQHSGADAVDAQRLAAWRMAREQAALIAHPANKTVLLLGGRVPWADLYPLGDVWATQVEALARRWSGPEEVEAVAAAAGGLSALDHALARMIDARENAAAALASLPAAAAQELVTLYERGRYFRLRARLVPKLGTRTLGIDLFD
jgi:hypothetical protein